MNGKKIPCLAALALAATLTVQAQTTWDGGGAADTSWGTAANWDNDTLPAFNGTDSLTVTAPSSGNTTLTLGADRSIGRITFGNGTAQMTLAAGNTLRLNSTTTSAAAGTALWNSNSSDSIGGIVHADLLLSCGTPGNYTGHFRENNNASGGTGRFNGAITQGTGENWTLRFSKASTRGTFFLNNADNDVYELHNAGAALYSMVPGAFGGAMLTLAGGITGTRTLEHVTSPIANDITAAGNSDWDSGVPAKLTGTLVQNARLRYIGGAVTIPAFSSVSGSAETVIAVPTVAPPSMASFASGTLTIGSIDTSQSGGILVLGSGDVPSWADFAAARTYNAAGGSGTWRILSNAVADQGGGFAARGSDLTIPAGSTGMTAATLDRNLRIGSTAGIGGERFANKRVIVQQPTTFTTGAQRSLWVGGDGGSKGDLEWTLAGPVHEISADWTGTDVRLAVMNQNRDGSHLGLLRLSGNNSFAGASTLVVGGKRSGFTTPAGRAFSTANPWDNGGAVLIGTSDAAFGGVDELLVYCVSSDTGIVGSLLLFEDATGTGTEFAMPVGILHSVNTTTRLAGIGSFAGEVTYTGTATVTGSSTAAYAPIGVHVQDGTLTLGKSGSPASLTINHTQPARLMKGGPGTLVLASHAIDGTQSDVAWDVVNGAVRETGAASANSMVDRNVRLRGGVIEFGVASRTLTLGTGTEEINMSGGGGFAAFGSPRAASLNGGAALTWGSTSSFLAATMPLVLGSRTADAPVDFQNDVNLNNGLRTLRSVDNPDSAQDRGILSGAITGTGNSALRFEGDGTLELAGANTYAGATTVVGGTLVVSGSLDAQTSLVTVQAGAALGGTGTVARGVVVESEGVIAATDAMTTTGLSIEGDLTVAGLVGIRVPAIAFGTYTVATVSGILDANEGAPEPLPEGYKGTLVVDGNVLKFKVSTDASATLILIR